MEQSQKIIDIEIELSDYWKRILKKEKMSWDDLLDEYDDLLYKYESLKKEYEYFKNDEEENLYDEDYYYEERKMEELENEK